MSLSRMIVGALFLLAAPCLATGQVAPSAEEPQAEQAQKVETAKGFRASNLIGMAVKNVQGEEIGTVKDLVINVETGEIGYAALSFGGFLGFGDKLFAMPWRELRFTFDEEQTYLVADLSQQKLESAPGFDEENWPDLTKEGWSAIVDQYYARPFHTGIVVAVEQGRLTMTDMEGKSEHSHAIARNTTITLDGQPAQLDDLKQGYRVKVTTEHRDGKSFVVRVDAHSAPDREA